MAGPKAGTDTSDHGIHSSDVVIEMSAAKDAKHGHGIVSQEKGPTDLPDDPRLHGIAHIFMLMALIMAVSLVASNATILGTVWTSYLTIL